MPFGIQDHHNGRCWIEITIGKLFFVFQVFLYLYTVKSVFNGRPQLFFSYRFYQVAIWFRFPGHDEYFLAGLSSHENYRYMVVRHDYLRGFYTVNAIVQHDISENYVRIKWTGFVYGLTRVTGDLRWLVSKADKGQPQHAGKWLLVINYQYFLIAVHFYINKTSFVFCYAPLVYH